MLPVPLQILTVCILGLLLGSFASALSWRVPRRLPWMGGRSECPSCHAALTPLDLIPIFSWLAARGRCRHCGAPIGWRYPAIELTIFIGCLSLYAAWGLNPAGLCAMLALPFLLTLFLVDLEQMILPDSMQTALFLLGGGFVEQTAAAGASSSFGALTLILLKRLLAAFVFAALIWLTGKAVSMWRRRDALGFGDVKFMAVTGLWLGLPYLPVFLIGSGVAGVLCGLAWRWLGRGKVFPFGPALILSFYACLLAKGAGFSPLALLQ